MNESFAPLSMRSSREDLTESPRAISTRSSREDIGHELSTIQESPLTEFYPAAAPEPGVLVTTASDGSLPGPPTFAGPFQRPTPEYMFGGTSSEGTTPRPITKQAPALTQEQSYQSNITVVPAKGKEKEEMDGYLVVGPPGGMGAREQSVYKTAPIPIPMPRAADERSIRSEASGFP